MRILITGASGLLGLNLALETAQGEQAGNVPSDAAQSDERHTVYGVVNQHGLRTDHFKVIKADLLVPGELERLLDQTQPDWIINCAALAILDACEANPEFARQLNTEMPRKLAAIVARGGARLLHVSTDSVFDGERGDYSEEDIPEPVNMYARTKLAGERAVAQANPDAVIARVVMYGWSMSGKRSLAEWFINNLRSGNSMLGFTDVFFCPLWVNDLAKLFLMMLSKGLKGLYHVVSPMSTSKYHFGVALSRQFGLDENLITRASMAEAGLKAARAPNLTLRSDKLAHDLRINVPSWEDGLPYFYDQYRRGYAQLLQNMTLV